MNQQHLKHLQSLLTKIPKGKVTTYKEVGKAMGTKGYRYIGYLLHNNPEPDRFPCYKVVNSNGDLGGFGLGCKDKIRRLNEDGIAIKNGKVVNFDGVFFRLSF